VREQPRADALALARREDVRVADQVDVLDGLDPDDPDERARLLVAPEPHAGGDLALELVHGHVGLVPAVGGDHPAVCLGRRVDDREDRLDVVVAAAADAPHRRSIYERIPPRERAPHRRRPW
jgi:hypothetical protein